LTALEKQSGGLCRLKFGRNTKLACMAFLLTVVFFSGSRAQYFGRNKVQYRTFDYKVITTEHFDIHYHEAIEKAALLGARMAERWYERLSTLLDHELSGRQVLVFYGNHSEFIQTNIIYGDLGEGTGGVTESLKRRIVLPLSGPLHQTNYIIGHELVHAFQYSLIGPGRSSLVAGSRLGRYPLWFIEGMAEYLSIGHVDPHTAMWMRDAVMKGDFPDLKDLAHPKYFPYRYGQALWAYMTGRYGDDVAGALMQAISRTESVRELFKVVLHTEMDSLSREWGEAMKAWAESVEVDSSLIRGSRPLAEAKSPMNLLHVAPSLSPDGTRLVYLSTRDLFSLDMYLADTTGRVIRKLTNTAVDPHYQSIQYINSSGDWSPDGKRFAFTAIRKGEPVLVIMELESGRTWKEILLPELGEAISPVWGPEGRRIILSAVVNGLNDLFMVDVETEKRTRLTQDLYAELQPAWSPDGRTLAFVTDRFGADLENLVMGEYRLALMDLETGDIRPVPGFDGAKHINPEWSKDSEQLYFLSDAGGITNIYRIRIEDGRLEKLTDVYTGITGISEMSPALSVADGGRVMAYTLYQKNGFSIYMTEIPEEQTAIEPSALSGMRYAVLPPVERMNEKVQAALEDRETGLPQTEEFSKSDYRPRLRLDYLSRPTLVFGADRFGGFIGGGVSLYWSDMMGEHNLVTMGQVDSRFKNYSGLLGYLNLRHRINWGLSVEQIPYYYMLMAQGYTQVENDPAYVEEIYIYKQTNRTAAFFMSYPFSRVQRLEFQTGYRNIDFYSEIRTRIVSATSNKTYLDKTTPIPVADPLHLFQTSAALVYDSAVYGLASPILGQRYRFEVSPVLGTLNYQTVLADYRFYAMPRRPFTLAMRLMHYGRYGKNAEDNRLYPLYIGYQGFIRGYDYYTFTMDEMDGAGSAFDVNRLLGTKVAVANLELRFPLFGLLGLGSGYYGGLPIETALFFDAGVAWFDYDRPWFLGGDRRLLSSYGLAMRVNMLGFVVAEVDIVKPLERNTGWIWQFGFTTGF